MRERAIVPVSDAKLLGPGHPTQSAPHVRLHRRSRARARARTRMYTHTCTHTFARPEIELFLPLESFHFVPACSSPSTLLLKYLRKKSSYFCAWCASVRACASTCACACMRARNNAWTCASTDTHPRTHVGTCRHASTPARQHAHLEHKHDCPHARTHLFFFDLQARATSEIAVASLRDLENR